MPSPPSTSMPVIVVCAVLLDPTDRFLAVQRPEGRSLEGFWEFPGGKIEPGESPEAALRRELKEELDLDPTHLGEFSPLAPVVHAYDFATIQLVPFLVPCRQRPSLTLLEHADHRWIAVEEADRIAWAPADLPVLEELGRVL
ncbi:MAG: (deoxy)nucleoside triphosphate pyrophosphohydrolase [Verrucomicrobiaceae bacterium]|nr:(deoxy)nucleoside triphosphate pyrophosphohydrolase [Verrucomicrobiaceae bacterium]